MVTYHKMLQDPTPEWLADEHLDDVRSAWVVDYRRDHAEAQRWAEGIWSVEHTVETQERVFRMVEQLAARGTDRAALFAAFRRADVLVDAAGRGQVDLRAEHLYVEGRAVRSDDVRSGPWATALAAADAGCALIDGLIGDRTVVSLLRPEAFEERLGRESRQWFPQTQAGRVMIVIGDVPSLDHLRSYGFDPITFDGADPAAFAWAIFELSNRLQAAVAQLRCDCHPSFAPVPLGVAVNCLTPERRAFLPVAHDRLASASRGLSG